MSCETLVGDIRHLLGSQTRKNPLNIITLITTLTRIYDTLYQFLSITIAHGRQFIRNTCDDQLLHILLKMCIRPFIRKGENCLR